MLRHNKQELILPKLIPDVLTQVMAASVQCSEHKELTKKQSLQQTLGVPLLEIQT
jgi:hypothetical protein